ncbi:MAG TPA: hypothetical protein VH062_07900 [Polyangiaceae bacterium]|nr:hypothetical protein [Polyangiaceae bacterium]
MVHALRAQVKNGRLVLDEPVDLPEGTTVDLVPADESDNLDDAERTRLHEALATSRAELARGEGVPLAGVIRELRAARR